MNYRKDIILNVLNLQDSVAISYKIYRAWVSEFQALPAFDAAPVNPLVIQSITIRCDGWERDVTVIEPSAG